jgi:alkylhydroperoxidase/carboxymuconolactone decarboxylase family protein YurZ
VIWITFECDYVVLRYNCFALYEVCRQRCRGRSNRRKMLAGAENAFTDTDLRERSTPLPKASLPTPVEQFRKRYPDVWKAFDQLGEQCHEAGPLDEKTRRLVKVALSIGAGLEGATHSAVRNARKSRVTVEELDQVAVLAVTTIGLPAAIRGFTWISDTADKS